MQCTDDVSKAFNKTLQECVDLNLWITQKQTQLLGSVEQQYGELSQQILLSMMQGLMYEAINNNPAVKRVSFRSASLGDGKGYAKSADWDALKMSKEATPFWTPELTFVVEKVEGPYVKVFEIALSRSRLWGASTHSEKTLPEVTAILGRTLEKSSLEPSVAPQELHRVGASQKHRLTSWEVFQNSREHRFVQKLSKQGEKWMVEVRDFYPLIVDIGLGNSSLWDWRAVDTEQTEGSFQLSPKGSLESFEGLRGGFRQWDSIRGIYLPNLMRIHSHSSWILMDANERSAYRISSTTPRSEQVAALRRCDFVGILPKIPNDKFTATEDLYKDWRTPGFCFTAVQVSASVIQ